MSKISQKDQDQISRDEKRLLCPNLPASHNHNISLELSNQSSTRPISSAGGDAGHSNKHAGGDTCMQWTSIHPSNMTIRFRNNQPRRQLLLEGPADAWIKWYSGVRTCSWEEVKKNLGNRTLQEKVGCDDSWDWDLEFSLRSF